jgi:hypothetical protein
MFDLIGALLRCRKTQPKIETLPTLVMLGLAFGRCGAARERHGREGEKVSRFYYFDRSM